LTSIISKAAIPDTSAGFGQAPAIIRQQPYRSLGQDHSVILSGKEDSAVFEIGVVIDPASELAQRWSHILRTLSQLESVHLRIHFNPNRFLPEVPIKRFYQYSFDHALEFDRATGLEVPASITFKDVPETILLTFATDLQRSWLAFPKQSVYDLDNIRLAQISDSARQNGINALLELESIILEGHSRDMPSQAPPRGLQLELSNGSNKDKSNITVDTIVMANLGYWQLKANPGIWQLAIRPGKSSEVFDLESIGSDGMNSPDIRETGNLIAVTTLEGSTLYPRFRRNKGFETVELLDDNAAASRGNRDSVMNKFRSL
jgi:UDP-glucose:glycoprotein glucosyltransferase